ncbi:MAG: LamG-like jellyroll fold domain-containing protein, partial [Verrucomicrobiota bacterium]
MTAATVRANYQSTVLGDNPLAYYSLNPASDPAGESPDLTTNGNNGVAVDLTAANGPTPYITNAANFNGDAAVDLSQSTNPAILNYTGPITLEGWVQPSSASLSAANQLGNIVAKGYDSGTYDEITLRANNAPGLNYDGGSEGTNFSVYVGGGAETTNWTYLVVSMDGTNCNLYENGVLVAQTADTNGSIEFLDDWVIGDGSSGGNSRFFNGNISQVALYNHGLSAAQVLNHFYWGEVNSSSSNSVPIILVQPQPQSVYAGGTATFSVTAISAFPTTNQWYTNNVPLPSQTNATLTISDVNAADEVNYRVVVGNKNGTTNSVSVGLSLLASGTSLKWSPNANSGVWDTEISSNWINVSNSQQTVFNTSDRVLFDDT